MHLDLNQIQQLKQEISIHQVLGETPGKTRVNCVLPGHNNDTSRDMYVDPTGSKFYCHKCKKGGDVIKLIQLTQGLNFGAAIDYLVTHYSQRDYELDNELIEERHKLLVAVLKIYQQELINSPAAQEYISSRGWNVDKFIEFGGYDSGLLLSNYFSIDLLVKHKLINTKPKITNVLQNRIIFPTYNLNGKLIQFVGRLITNNTQQPKLLPLSSNNQFIYKFNNYLFNERILAEPLNYVFICEGQPDTYTLMEMGINAVGLSGNNNLYKHAYKFSKVQNIGILLDNDKPTQDRLPGEVIKFLYKLKSIKSNSNVFVIELPDNLMCKDINELKVKYNIDKKFISGLKRYKAKEFLIKKLATDKKSHSILLPLLSDGDLELLSKSTGISMEALIYGRAIVDPIR